MRARTDERILSLIQKDERIVARFWELVNKGESATACWHWNGSVSKRLPCFHIGRRCTAAARISWWTATGAFPSGGRFYRICQNKRCVRPDHLAWQLGRNAERALDPYGDFAPSGVVVRAAVTAGERLQVFRFVTPEAASTLCRAG